MERYLSGIPRHGEAFWKHKQAAGPVPFGKSSQAARVNSVHPQDAEVCEDDVIFHIGGDEHGSEIFDEEEKEKKNHVVKAKN